MGYYSLFATLKTKTACALAGLFLFLAGGLGAETAKDDFLFLNNGKVRVGVDLSSGGSVFYFSAELKRRNLLNHHDRGRFVQQSFYGDKDGSRWAGKPWRWNPVQGGDDSGNPAKVIEHRHTETTLYVKSTPRHWAAGYDVTDSAMEQWISLEGDVAEIRYEFTYKGELNHRARHQEMPAVFVDYAMPNLVYYKGDKPWTGDAVSSIVPGWPNEHHSRTEEWSAFVDETDWGIGVYTPGTGDITCYRHTGLRDAGPKGSACSYFAPVRKLAITSGVTVVYEVYLSIGKVDAIRNRFYKIRVETLAKAAKGTEAHGQARD